MKRFKIRYSEEFVEHLETYIEKLEAKSPQAANKLREHIKKYLINLKRFPKIGNKVQSSIKRLTKYRKIVIIFDYLIFYYLDEREKTVYIVDIIHGKQNYEHLLK